MKPIRILTLAAALGLSVAAHAADPKPAATPLPSVEGRILSVDAAKRELTLETAAAKDGGAGAKVTVTWTEKTELMWRLPKPKPGQEADWARMEQGGVPVPGQSAGRLNKPMSETRFQRGNLEPAEAKDLKVGLSLTVEGSSGDSAWNATRLLLGRPDLATTEPAAKAPATAPASEKK